MIVRTYGCYRGLTRPPVPRLATAPTNRPRRSLSSPGVCDSSIVGAAGLASRPGAPTDAASGRDSARTLRPALAADAAGPQAAPARPLAVHDARAPARGRGALAGLGRGAVRVEQEEMGRAAAQAGQQRDGAAGRCAGAARVDDDRARAQHGGRDADVVAGVEQPPTPAALPARRPCPPPRPPSRSTARRISVDFPAPGTPATTTTASCSKASSMPGNDRRRG